MTLMRRKHMRKLSKIAVTGIVLLSFLDTGCVRRRMMVRSYPEGALAYVDQQEIGRTPVAVPFTYYGTREIRLEKDGFETIKAKHKVSAPWYQIPPLDFVAENLWPREIRDERVVEFQLAPQRQIPESELMQRANQLRSNVQQGIATPLISTAPDQRTSPGLSR